MSNHPINIDTSDVVDSSNSELYPIITNTNTFSDSSPDDAINNNNNNLFIFKESEFEAEMFVPAAFVAKYRRVCSMESLREQLRSYSESLKHQLYDIINRDYKDFITIGTKLDGVDMRIEHLRKPLVDLRLDLASLHDGLITSMQAIDDKLNERSKVAGRKALLETCLFCMNKLDSVDEVCNPSKGLPQSTSANANGLDLNDRPHARSRRDLLRTMAHSRRTSSHVTAVQRDVFECAELERAAASIAAVFNSIHELESAGSSNANSSSSRTVAFPLDPGHSGLLRSMEQRARHLLDLLTTRIKGRMASIFSSSLSSELSSSSSLESSDASTSTTTQNEFPFRSWRHLVRALELLGKEEMIGEVFAEAVTIPAAKSSLTQGRVDGTGGRSSYTGLQECLFSILDAIRHSLMQCNVPVGYASTTNDEIKKDVDRTRKILVVHGVWMPISRLLIEKFGGMFTAGIAGTMSRCYRALDTFLQQLGLIVGENWNAASKAVHVSVKDFHSKWKLEIYLQLRLQEISTRLERCCETSRVYGIMSTNASTSSSAQPGKTGLSSPQQSILSLSESQMTELSERLTLSRFRVAAVRNGCLEAATCFHETVLLRALGPKLLALALRLFVRLEALICSITESSTPSFPNGAPVAPAPITPSDRIAPAGPPPSTSATTVVSATPSKKPSATELAAQNASPGVSSISTSATLVVPAVVLGSQSATPTPDIVSGPTSLSTVDDLAALTEDLHSLGRWLCESYANYVVQALCSNSSSSQTHNGDIIRRCLSLQSEKMMVVKGVVWTRIVVLLAQECRNGLGAVKTVASKFRMTNKPAPTTHSTYVDSVLQPFRLFISKNESMIRVCAPEGQWKIDLIEDCASQFVVQVQSLMETVRSMDTALQRRSKLKSSSTAPAVGASLTDSEKISLQLYLDVRQFEVQIVSLGVNVSQVPSFQTLIAEVREAEKFAQPST